MAKPKVYSGFNSETAEKLLLDAGAFLKNFVVGTDTFESAVTADKLIGATSGGGTFSAVPTVRKIEIDGVKGAAKGLEVIDEWVVTLMANIKEVSVESIQAALGAATISDFSNDYYKVQANNYIELTDYIDNIVWVGKLSGSNIPVIIEVSNAISLGGLALNMADKAEGLVPTTFTGHYDYDDLDTPPFAVYYPKTINNTVTVDKTSFSKGTSPTDIKFTVVSSGGAIPTGIKLNNVVINNIGTNFTIAGSVLTLKQGYITTLNIGKYNFVVETDKGNDALSPEIEVKA